MTTPTCEVSTRAQRRPRNTPRRQIPRRAADGLEDDGRIKRWLARQRVLDAGHRRPVATRLDEVPRFVLRPREIIDVERAARERARADLAHLRRERADADHEPSRARRLGLD